MRKLQHRIGEIIYLTLIICLLLSCDKYRVVNTVYHGDKLMWEHINRTGPAVAMPGVPGGAVIPHHTITASAVARFYKGLSQKIDPELIFILSPNHFETGGNSIITGDNLYFNTVYGNLETDKTVIGKLVKRGLATVHNKTFLKEHGIFFHAPFIKKYFPKAKVAPLLLMWKNKIEENNRLSDFIHEHSNRKSFVIASVDFSHYQPKAVADFHDETSHRAIVNFQFDLIYNLEVDSPSSLYVLLKTMDRSGYKRGKRFMHTNSDIFLNKNEKETTSHQYFGFFKGEVKKEIGVSILLSGNIDLKNETLYLRSKWDWNKNYDSKKDNTIERYLKNLRGVEDRFFIGSDIYLFDVKEFNSPQILSVADERIAIVKFSRESLSLREQLLLIERLKDKNSYVVVLYAYSGKEVASLHGKRFRAFVDAGADVVAGKGNRGILKEVYKKKPVFYSIGDFLTDRKNGVGEMAGVVLTKESCTVYNFPIKLSNKYPAYGGKFDPPAGH